MAEGKKKRKKEKEFVIPDIITTDISFQLMFGFEYPKDHPQKSQPIMDEYKVMIQKTTTTHSNQ